MKTGVPVIAIFDIGKTNKRFLLFDRDYRVVYERSARLEETTDEEGYVCENLPALMAWMKQTLDDALFNGYFHMKALNFSAYGASFVHLDKRGIPVTPLYSYLKPYPENILNKFYTEYGSREQIALETSSPPLGMLNSGLQLYWLKHHKPEIYKKIKCSLHLPQYFSYLITNKATAEMTSIGCHTALWNFQTNSYHQWVQKENIAKLFPQIYPNHYKMDIPLGKYKFCAGIGIHDSSAAFIPYLLTEKEPFVLLSTGTWNIVFNPFNEEPVTAEELNKDCLAYLSPDGKPVKAARLFLGNEHDHYSKKIATYFDKNAQYHTIVQFNKAIVQRLLQENNRRKKFLPETIELSKYFYFTKHKAVDLSLFGSFEEAYHQLNIDLVAMQAIAIEAASGPLPVKKLFVTGGFCNNPIFIQLLASRFPEMQVYTATMPEASALGAALVMHKCWNDGKEIKNTYQLCEPQRDIAMIQYEMAINKA